MLSITSVLLSNLMLPGISPAYSNYISSAKLVEKVNRESLMENVAGFPSYGMISTNAFSTELINSTIHCDSSNNLPVAQVYYVKGKVDIESPAFSISLNKGTVIYHDSLVRVGSDGFVALISRGETILLQPLTATLFLCDGVERETEMVSPAIDTPYFAGTVRG